MLTRLPTGGWSKSENMQIDSLTPLFPNFSENVSPLSGGNPAPKALCAWADSALYTPLLFDNGLLKY